LIPILGGEEALNLQIDFTAAQDGALRRARIAPMAGMLAALLVLVLGLAHFSAAQTTPSTARPAGTPAKPHTAAAKPEVAAGPPVKTYGLKTAPIVMEVFTDYQCPSCRNLFEQTLRPMISDYVASGKVYLIHHDFPLPGHKYGYEAARWANAAARVGEFSKAEAALYDNQDAWGSDGNIEKYISAAMPADAFKRVQRLMEGCQAQTSAANATPRLQNVAQTSHGCALDPYIDADRSLGLQIPVQATPTYVISYKGQKLPAGSGVVSWPILKQFFDSLLSH
jgi:protein-disulfide isomerase